MGTYLLRDSAGRVVLRAVPSGQREQALHFAAMMDAGIRKAIARGTGSAMAPKTYSWELEQDKGGK